MPFIQLVNDRGQLTDTTPWAGMFVKTADKQIISDIKANGRLFKTAEFEMTILSLALRHSAFILRPRELVYKDDTAEGQAFSFQQVNKLDTRIHTRRQNGQFLENIIDWEYRERYWGTPCPYGYARSAAK